MKKHNLFKVLGITVFVAIVLTWIFPQSYMYYGEFYEDARNQVGLFDLLNDFNASIQYFGNIALYLLLVGGFYGVIHHISAYRNLLDTIVSKFKRNESIFMVVVSILIALVTAFAGLQTGIIFLFPFVISILLLMGYDKITAALVTVGSTIVGIIGTVYNANALYVFAEEGGLALQPNVNAGIKVLLLFIGLVVLLYFTLTHAARTRDTKNLVKGDYIPEETDKKAKTWPLIVVIDLFLIIMILSHISWSEVFEITIFEDLHEALVEFKLFDFPIFAKLLGTTSLVSFGNWSINHLSVMLLISTALLALMYKVKFNDLVSHFASGVKKALMPALLVVIAYTSLIIAVYNPVILTMTKPILSATSGLNVATMSLVAFVSSIFNVDLYYSASGIVAYIVTIITDTSVYPTIALIWQGMYGLAMLVAPTSVVLISTLAYLNIPYGKWLKAIWKVFVTLAICLLIVSTIIFVM